MARTTKKIEEKNKRNKKDSDQKNNESFSFENEIVIGVTRKVEDKPQKGKKKQTKKSKKEVNIKQINNRPKNKKVEKNVKKKKIRNEISPEEQVILNKKKIRRNRIIKYTVIIIAIFAAIIVAMLSPLFNIKNIKVEGIEKLSESQIISLSEIVLGENTFKINKGKVIKSIKQNPYIESVSIKRKLPSELEITIKERVTTFLIEYAGSYLYINNQGYILEISTEKLEMPIIQGIITSTEDFKEGNRLCVEDLKKLDTVIKIVDLAKNAEIYNILTRIDIENKDDYKIAFESEEKIAYLGDSSNLSTKMLNIKAILEKESGIPGEIFVNVDLNSSYPMFRQRV